MRKLNSDHEFNDINVIIDVKDSAWWKTTYAIEFSESNLISDKKYFDDKFCYHTFMAISFIFFVSYPKSSFVCIPVV